MTPQQFITKWRPVALTERATAQSHFIDLCALVGHEDPIKADPAGEWFTFEKGVTKTGGGEGFADVWKKGFFAWEYKKKKRNLEDALNQLVRYAAALENPPLQVACDTDRFLIRTAWTNAIVRTYEFSLDDIAEPKNLNILRSVFFGPEKLRPKETRAGVTKEVADKAPSGFGEEAPEHDLQTILGREQFAKISEVEGIRLGDAAKEALAEFDRQGLPADERRRAIIGRFKPAAK